MTSPPIARKALVLMHVVCLGTALLFGAMAYLEADLVRLSAEGFLLSALLLEAALLRMTLVARRPEPLEPRADGSVVAEAPVLLVVLLVGTWVSAVLVLLGWVAALLTGPLSARTVVLALGLLIGLGSLGDLARLLTGRLHRWRVVADGSGVRYRGYRTDRSLRWGEVSAVRSSADPPGVAVEPRDGSPAVLLPALAFDVTPDALAMSLERRRTRLEQR